MVSYSFAPVDPVSVVWTPCALDFHMSLDGGACVAGEAGSTVGWLEGPSFPVVYSPVCARDPVFLLVGVAGDCPSLQHRVDGVVKSLQDPCTLGIQRLHQRLLRCVLMMVNRLAQFCHMSSDCRLTGLDQRFATMQASAAIFPSMGLPRWVWSDMQAEEVASRGSLCFYEGVGDARLAGLQSASHLLQPLCSHFLALHDDLAILVQDHKVIGIDHDFGCLKASAPAPWKLLAQDRLETVQGTVGH